MATDTYREPLTCEECGCFVSRHDDQCSQWTEPLVRRIPCELVWAVCGRAHETVRSGPAFASYHTDEVQR